MNGMKRGNLEEHAKELANVIQDDLPTDDNLEVIGDLKDFDNALNSYYLYNNPSSKTPPISLRFV